jgi:hypothetical protein
MGLTRPTLAPVRIVGTGPMMSAIAKSGTKLRLTLPSPKRSVRTRSSSAASRVRLSQSGHSDSACSGPVSMLAKTTVATRVTPTVIATYAAMI